jgi:hypothetical protein
LADELVVCAEEKDTSPTTTAGLRSVIASFLDTPGASGVLFLFRLASPTRSGELDRWIDRHLVRTEDAEPSATEAYQVEQLVYDSRLAHHRHNWENTHFYSHVIARLGPERGCLVSTTFVHDDN